MKIFIASHTCVIKGQPQVGKSFPKLMASHRKVIIGTCMLALVEPHLQRPLAPRRPHHEQGAHDQRQKKFPMVEPKVKTKRTGQPVPLALSAGGISTAKTEN